MPLNRLIATSIVLLALLGFAPAAVAHPHVWVKMTSELVYDDQGRLTGIRQHWAFDDMFSAYATQGIEQKEKGKFSREELRPLAQTNVESLKEFDYFTYVTADGKKVPLADPLPDYWLDYKDGILTLNFTLPLKSPVKASNMTVDVYDPSIFVDFAFADGAKPVSFAGSAPSCKLSIELPREMTFAEGKLLSQEQQPAASWGAQFANKIHVNCK